MPYDQQDEEDGHKGETETREGYESLYRERPGTTRLHESLTYEDLRATAQPIFRYESASQSSSSRERSIDPWTLAMRDSRQHGPWLQEGKVHAVPHQPPEEGGHYDMENSTWWDSEGLDFRENYWGDSEQYLNAETVGERRDWDTPSDNLDQDPWTEDSERDATKEEWAAYQATHQYRHEAAENRVEGGYGRNDEPEEVTRGNRQALWDLAEENGTCLRDFAPNVKRKRTSLGNLGRRIAGN